MTSLSNTMIMTPHGLSVKAGAGMFVLTFGELARCSEITDPLQPAINHKGATTTPPPLCIQAGH